MSTDEIGLARLAEGLELIRVGQPLRPEFAAWRYGDQFVSRRRRARKILWPVGAARWGWRFITYGAGAGFLDHIGLHAAMLVGGGVTVVGVSGRQWWERRVVTRVRVGMRTVDVRQKDLSHATFRLPTSDDEETPDGWVLRLHHSGGAIRLQGDPARRAAGAILTRLNWAGGPRDRVVAATRMLSNAGGPEQYLAQAAARLARPRTVRGKAPSVWSMSMSAAWSGVPPDVINADTLAGLEATNRMALEMALHEESERRAMEGELAALLLAWREAEEVAAISDNLFLPASVHAWLKRRGRPASE